MIKINNKTMLIRRLSYKAIGSIIDKYMSDDGFTMYEGMKNKIYFEYGEHSYSLDVKYGKRDVTYIFESVKE